MEGKKIHHANIILGANPKQKVSSILECNLEFKIRGNPDFFLIEQESFGIDDARMLGEWAVMKPFSGRVKAALVLAQNITLEAQNALLKVLEEPKEGTYIFISLANIGALVPTLLSRVQVVRDMEENEDDHNKSAKKFLKSDVRERLKMISALSKSFEKNQMKFLIADLERAAHEPDNFTSAQYALERVLIKAKIMSKAQGSSPKMLLEWLASVL